MEWSYFAREIGKIHYQPGTWNGLRVGVFRRSPDGHEEQVGEYERNYSSLLRTFFHFRAGGRDLALYSPDYTGTRLMELPSCRDIGGEERGGGGFCPAEFFVPSFIDLEWSVDNEPPRRLRKQMPAPEDLLERSRAFTTRAEHYRPMGPLTYHPFGFVAGCVWGDDSSWKLQYLDLSRATEGVILRDERFGYLELPNGVTLDRAIGLIEYQGHPTEEYAHRVRITLTKQFDLRDGREIDPLD